MNDKYLHFKVEDFVADEDFIEWVYNNKFHSKWIDWLYTNSDKVKTVEEAKYLIENLKFSEIHLDQTSTENLWGKINSHTPSKNSNIKRMIFTWITATAACLTFLYFNDFNTNQIKIDAITSKAMQYTLPEESVVTLQNGSTAEYDNKNFKSKRVIKLDGQAFFQVKKGSSFIVETAYGKVQVLGTSFNVSTIDKNLVVHCYEGKVKVYDDKKSTILLPEEKINITTDAEKEKFGKYDEAPLWVDSEINIKSKTVLEVVSMLEDIFSKKIILDLKIDLNSKYTGVINAENIDEALKTFTWPLKLEYFINGNEIKITKEHK